MAAAACTPEPAGGELELADRAATGPSRATRAARRARIPVAPWRLVRTSDEAVAAARGLGYPVVVKIVAPEILHKSDIGGVALAISDDEVREAFDRVIAAGSRVAGARVEGAIVAAMRTGRIEMIVGVVCDQQWGPTRLRWGSVASGFTSSRTRACGCCR